MPALIDLRRRIKSIKNTQQITQAMKTVSTAKFKKSQRTVVEGRSHWHTLPGLMKRVSAWAGRQASPLLDRREEHKVDILVITSDKGLCGAFNSNLLARAAAFLGEKSPSAEIGLILIGKKAVHFFKKQPYPILLAHADKVEKLALKDLREIARFLMRRYTFARTDAVYAIYNEFKSILAPKITVAQLLPVALPEGEKSAPAWSPDWMPDSARLLQSLLPLYMETQVFHCFFESLAAEQAARMMAMENATKNAEDLISDLVLILNKIRQASITKELLEIMTAVEALAK
ncbi:MAG: ATP synthase F1 subunit gamma [Clostridiales bacterium]|jgi:F-type H+-transporting ATPase subunit gamma|nr:ATP synthase F1 subunit gamma [Clostridiales bacterium]